MHHSFSHSRDMTIARPNEWMRVPSRTCASSKARVRCHGGGGGRMCAAYAEHGARATRSWAEFRHHRDLHRAAYVPVRSGRMVLLNNNYCFETSASSSKKYGQGGNARNLFDSIFHNNQSAATFLPNNCLLYTSPSPRDATLSRMPSSA